MQNIRLTLAAVAIMVLMNASLAAEALYKTSFENFKEGALSQFVDGEAVWNSEDGAELTKKFKKDGEQALHIFGGSKKTVVLNLDGGTRNSRGFEFDAERWTSRSPFEFRVEAQVNGEWKEISNLDSLIAVGARLTSHIVQSIPAGSVSALKLICTSPDKSGAIIDNFALLEGTPANVTQAPKVATEQIRRIISTEDLFVSGTENTHTFRIPAIVTAPNGDLLVVCDARRKSSADLIWVRDIDIAIKRSSDNGRTWSNMELICDYGDGLPASDPSLIVDRKTGEIFCFYNFMDQDNAPKEFRLYVQSSTDNGKSWSKGRDITDSISKPEWKTDFKFITSGRGIQTRGGVLLHTMVNLKNGLHVFGSKDHGKNWTLIDVPVQPANESKIIELTDGRLMINSRKNGGGCRWVHRSTDNGKSWTSAADRALVDPGCNAVILNYTAKMDGYKKDRLLFCNANSFKGRKNLTLKISYDNGDTWSDGKVIDPGASAYSDMTILSDGTIGILYEPGYKAVRFTKVTLEDLTDGKDKLCKPYREY